jgi:hypothetical protein
VRQFIHVTHRFAPDSLIRTTLDRTTALSNSAFLFIPAFAPQIDLITARASGSADAIRSRPAKTR